MLNFDIILTQMDSITHFKDEAREDETGTEEEGGGGLTTINGEEDVDEELFNSELFARIMASLG